MASKLNLKLVAAVTERKYINLPTIHRKTKTTYWTAQELVQLIDYWNAGKNISEIHNLMYGRSNKRTEGAVQAKMSQLIKNQDLLDNAKTK